MPKFIWEVGIRSGFGDDCLRQSVGICWDGGRETDTMPLGALVECVKALKDWVDERFPDRDWLVVGPQRSIVPPDDCDCGCRDD